MNCKDCKHWVEYFETRGYLWVKAGPIDRFKEDEDPKPAGYGDCECPKMMSDEIENPDFLVWDPGHDGWIKIGPMFGCVHFEPKR